MTLKNILTKGIINDLAIAVREKLLLLMEAQSSWNENMAFRMLEYLTNRKKEVAKIMLSLFDQEVAVEDYGVSMFRQGRDEGREEERKNIIDILVKQGVWTREEAIEKLNNEKNNKNQYKDEKK